MSGRREPSRGTRRPAVARARTAARAGAAEAPDERRSLAWLLAGDRSATFGRSLALACVAAVVWAVGLHWMETPLLRREAVSAAVVERLLLDVEVGSAHRLAALTRRLPTRWTVPDETRQAIGTAAGVVGVDTSYLLAVAALESSFESDARAAGSTARGLYQFTEDTWLRVVKVFGTRHGLAEFSAAIVVRDDGSVFLRQSAERKTLMALRSDPAMAALMAAELAVDNKMRLESLLGRPASAAETYLAHFLGVAPAARMIETAHAQPQVPAARLLPAAAEANPGVFGPPGDPVSAGAIVAHIEAYFRDDVPRLAGT